MYTGLLYPGLYAVVVATAVPPTNTTAATAVVMPALPYSTTQRVDAGGVTYSVWYRLVVPECVTLLGIVAYGDASAYTPLIEVYVGPASAPVLHFANSGTNDACQVPVVPGTEYFLRFVTNSGDPAPALLSLSVVAGPSGLAPAGSIVIPDDTPGYPAIVVGATTGLVVRSLHPFPATEEGDSLPGGTMVVTDPYTDHTYKVYAASGTLLATIPALGPNEQRVRATPGANLFYLSDEGNPPTAPVVGTLTATGTLGPTTWTLPATSALNSLAGNNDGTIAYYAVGTNSALRRWDLESDSALSDLVAAVTGYHVTDILVLPDDTILVAYNRLSPRHVYVQRYSAAGAAVITYDFGTNHKSLKPRLSSSHTAGAFWVYTHPATGPAVNAGQLLEVRVSDGVTLTTLTVPKYEAGSYVPPISAADPVPFGISPSCPIFPLPTTVPACEPTAPVEDVTDPLLAWVEWRGREPATAAMVRRQVRAGLPRADVEQTRVYSDWDMQCPPSYYHGFKAARVESFGLATRTLSDPRTGAWHGSSTEIRLSDVDRLFRTALEATPQRFGADALVIVRMVTRAIRAALGMPLTVFAGPIRRAEPAPPLSFALLLEDAVGHAMLTDELLIPQRQVAAATLPPTLVLAEGAIGHPVPIIYGTHARETGAVAPVYLGIEGGTQHVWLVAGHYAAVTNVLLDGLSVLGADGTDWTLPGRSGPLVEDYGGHRVTLLRGRVGTPPSVTDPVLYAENAGAGGGYFESWFGGRLQFGHLFPTTRWDVAATSGARSGTRCLHGVDLRAGDAAIGHFGATGAPGTAVLRGYAVNDYSALVLYVKSETAGWVGDALVIRFSIFWDDDLAAAGVDVTLEDGAYGFDSFDTTDYQRIEIPIADFEIPEDLRPDRLWIVKAGAGEDLSVLIDDINLIGGETAVGEQTPADRAAAGAAFAINVTGWTTTGTASGSVITDLYAQYQHFLITYVAHPAGYLTGGPLTNPLTDLYDRVVQVIDESSFADAAAQAVARVPPTGYEGRGVLGATAGDRLPVREWIARWNLSADCRFGVSRYGELFIVLADPTGADRDAARLVDEVNDILAGSLVVTVGWEVQATRVPYRADYHWAQGTWLTDARDAEDPALAAVYGRPAGVDSPVKAYWFVPTAAQGKNVAQHELARIGHPPRVLEFETALPLATASLGGYLRVRHFAGVGPDETRLVQIEELTVAPGRRRVRIRAVDVTGLLPTAALLGARSARLGLARVGLSRVGATPEED